MQSLQWGAGMFITKCAVYTRTTLEVPARRVVCGKCHQWLCRFGWWHRVYGCGITEPGAVIELVYRGIAKSSGSTCCITPTPYMVTVMISGCMTSPGCADGLFTDGMSTPGYGTIGMMSGTTEPGLPTVSFTTGVCEWGSSHNISWRETQAGLGNHANQCGHKQTGYCG